MCLMCKLTKNVKWLYRLGISFLRIRKSEMSFFHLQKSPFMQFCNSMREPISFLSAVKEARNNICTFHLYPWQQRRSKSELEENRVYFLQRAIVKTNKNKQKKNKKQNCCLMTECGQYSCARQAHWGSPHGGDTHPVTPPTPKEGL